MYDKIKTYIKDNLGDLAFGVICVAIIVLFMYGAGKIFGTRTTTTDNNVDGTVSTIKRDIDTTRDEINKSVDQVQQAQSGISRATESVRESRERASSMSSTTDECQQLINECISDNKQAREILHDIRNSNSSLAGNK